MRPEFRPAHLGADSFGGVSGSCRATRQRLDSSSILDGTLWSRFMPIPFLPFGLPAGIGLTEYLIIFAVFLLLFGGTKLPQLRAQPRSVGD